jgi:hypothetical protein
MIYDNYTFDQALHDCKLLTSKLSLKSFLLLGNGFSISCRQEFSYKSLYDELIKQGINTRIVSLFSQYQLYDIESVLSILINAEKIANIYNFSPQEIASDYEEIKRIFIKTIGEIHPSSSRVLTNESKTRCYEFIKMFSDVFTVNYDLLLHWVNNVTDSPHFSDYFAKEADTPNELCEYLPQKYREVLNHIYYLHGALHLFEKGSRIFKLTYQPKNSLLVKFRQLLAQNHSPLFVAEGSPEYKIDKIMKSSYLSHCLRSFNKIEDQLFVYGFSFSKNDKHIFNSIVSNQNLKYLWLGFSSNKIRIKHIAENIEEERRKLGLPTISINIYRTNPNNIW